MELPLPELEALLALLRANKVTHFNTPSLELRLGGEAKQAAETQELARVTPQPESESDIIADVSDGADAEDNDEDEALFSRIIKANFAPNRGN